MSRIIMAKVILRDTCDPGVPGDCAPVIQVEEASELEGLVSEHGVIFEEPIQEQEETFADPVDYDEPWEDLAGDNEPWEAPVEVPEGPEMEGDVCLLEPDKPWDQSVCGKIEDHVVSRILGG